LRIEFDRLLESRARLLWPSCFAESQAELKAIFGVTRRQPAGDLKLAHGFVRSAGPAEADGKLMMQPGRICVPLNGARKPDEARLDLTAVEKEDAQLQSATGLIAVLKQLVHEIE